MNTNDLPPAARLASLIEAGSAGNPDLAHGRGALLAKGKACAVGFACLAAGFSRTAVIDMEAHCGDAAMDAVTVALAVPSTLLERVVSDNDSGARLGEICHELREGELAKVAA